MSNQYDILIKNPVIVDGTGKSPFSGDIAIENEKIVSVGEIDGKSKEVIDGTGLTACPGFVDVHNHTDLVIYKHPEAFHLAMQGITTFAGGNCGASTAPFRNAELVKKFAGPDVPIFLGGTKIDLLDEDDLENAHITAKELVERNNLISYILTSSKTGINIKETFVNIIELLFKDHEEKLAKLGE